MSVKTLGNLSGFCALMKVFESQIFIKSRAFKSFRQEYMSSAVTLDHVLLPAFQDLYSSENEIPLCMPYLVEESSVLMMQQSYM